jgi:tetratricopeptide (TPR) repeat protein
MAKSSMARAIRTAGFAMGLAVVLLMAITPSLAASLFSDAPQVVAIGPRTREVVTFTSPDPLGVSFVTHATVSVTTGHVLVTLLRNSVNISSVDLNQAQRETLAVEPTMWAASASWSLILQNELGNLTTYVQFVLEKGVVPTFFSSVPLLLFLYGGTQVAWWVVLRPIRDRTKAASLSVAAELDENERVFDGMLQSPNPGTSRALDSEAYSDAVAHPHAEVAVDPPTLPPPAAPRSPPPPMEVSKPPPRAVVRQPETAASLAKKAEALAAAGSYDAALQTYEDALALDSSHLPSLLGRGSCLTRLSRKTEALETYRRILGQDARNVAAHRMIVRLHADERRWRECLEAVGDLLRLRPNDAAALEMKGDALTNLGRRPEALAAYEEAAALDTKNENLRQKIEEVRVDVPGLLSRALIASASGNYGQALGLFDDILEVEPSNVNALIGKAVAYRRSGKPQEALNCLDLVLGVQPNNASALLNRGNILFAEGDLEAALDAFDHLTQLYPNDEEAWAAEGDVLVKMGRDDDALRAYTEAARLSPGDEGIQRHILEMEAAKTPRSDMFQELFQIKGIGKMRAKSLVDAGFKTPEDFAKANPKDLMVVKGITRKIAEDLCAHFRAALAEAR